MKLQILKRTFRALRKSLCRQSNTNLEILCLLCAEKEPVEFKAIQADMEIAQSVLSDALSKMVYSGMVNRSTTVGNRRVVEFSPTQKGYDLVKSIQLPAFKGVVTR